MNEYDDDINGLVERLADQADVDETPRYLADSALRRAEPGVLREMAVRYLASATTDLVRQRTAAAERRAEDTARERWTASWDAKDDGPGGRERKRWEARRRSQEVRWTQRHAELRQQTLEAITKWTAELRMEWTAELLESTFAMRDGTRVTWGEATVDQHRERAEMFEGNVIANAQGAARHRYALGALESSGAQSLHELVSEQEAVR